jgi:site-specific recombinase XerD
MICGQSVLKFQEGPMVRWPDDESMLKEYVEKLGYSNAASYCGWLRQFQRFVSQHSPRRGLTERVFRTWIIQKAEKSPRSVVIRQTQFIKGFLDWLVQQNVVLSHPLDDLQRKYQCRSIQVIANALISSDPDQALQALRPLPRYGSHLGCIMREHIQRMRTLGCRYEHEHVFLRFDRFLQQRPDADHESVGTLIQEYVAGARSINARLRRLILGRIIAQALNRQGTSVAVLPIDPLLLGQNRNQQLRPYIYTEEEVERLLTTARGFPSPRAPLRPLTLYTMLTLAYCAGLRLGEIVRLRMRTFGSI